jgi:hypothetical protein
MARPHLLDLRATQQPWRKVPMPGANLGLELVRLEADRDGFTILGRFPAGFARVAAGGYEVAEEFLVLDGELELEGTVVRRGDLCAVAAGVVRAPMRSPLGCRMLAWFAGPAVFLPAEELGGSAGGPPRSARATPDAGEGFEEAAFRVAHPRTAPAGTAVLRTGEATWQVVGGAAEVEPDGAVAVVDVDLTTWIRMDRGTQPSLPPGPLLVRRPRAAGVPRP